MLKCISLSFVHLKVLLDFHGLQTSYDAGIGFLSAGITSHEPHVKVNFQLSAMQRLNIFPYRYVHIPSENEEDVLPSEQDLKPQGLSMETDERASQGSVEQRSPSPTTVEDETAVQVLHSAPQQTRKRKRQLEEKCSSDSDVIDLTQD